MFPQAERFDKWLRRRSPHAATPIHYTNDLKLFFARAGKPPQAITLHSVDAYVLIANQAKNHRADTGRALGAQAKRAD